MQGTDLFSLSKTRDLIQFNEPLISKKTKPIQLAKLIDQAKKAVARFTKLTNSIKIKVEPAAQPNLEAETELEALKTDFEGKSSFQRFTLIYEPFMMGNTLAWRSL